MGFRKEEVRRVQREEVMGVGKEEVRRVRGLEGDVVLRSRGGNESPAHRSILASASQLFRLEI